MAARRERRMVSCTKHPSPSKAGSTTCLLELPLPTACPSNIPQGKEKEGGERHSSVAGSMSLQAIPSSKVLDV